MARFIEYVVVFDLIFDPNDTSQGLFDFFFALGRILPSVKPDEFDDGIDVIDDTRHDNRRFFGFHAVEKLG